MMRQKPMIFAVLMAGFLWIPAVLAQAVEEALPPDLPPLPTLPAASAPAKSPSPKPTSAPMEMKMEVLPAATATLPETPPMPAIKPQTVPVAKVPVMPPGTPNPPPANPSFVPGVAEEKPGTLETLKDLVENPEKIQDTISKLPQQVGDIKSVERNIRRAVSGPPGPPGGFDGEDFSKLSFPQSLMFSEQDLKRLYDAVKGIAPPGAEGGPVMVEVKTPKVAPAFYLNSVLYESPANWTIWLNSRRIRRGAKFPELEIASVREDRVEFIWQTDSLDFISPDWDKKIKPIPIRPGASLGRWAYVSRTNDVFVDLSRRYVRFFLGPHQTFISRSMEIVEGKVNSTFFDVIRQQPARGGAGQVPAGAIPGVGTPPRSPGASLQPVIPAGQGGVQGAIPGAAPGSPMGPARAPSAAPSSSLNPVALPSAITTPLPVTLPTSLTPTPAPAPTTTSGGKQ